MAVAGTTKRVFWNWDEIEALEINEIAAHRSFVFLVSCCQTSMYDVHILE